MLTFCPCLDAETRSLSGTEDDPDARVAEGRPLDAVSLDGEDDPDDALPRPGAGSPPPSPPPPPPFLWSASESHSPPLSLFESVGGFPPLPPSAQEYFARYYQMVHRQHQEKAAAALNAAAEASAKLASPALLHRRYEAGLEQQTI